MQVIFFLIFSLDKYLYKNRYMIITKMEKYVLLKVIVNDGCRFYRRHFFIQIIFIKSIFIFIKNIIILVKILYFYQGLEWF